jgi:hypothetical protein
MVWYQLNAGRITAVFRGITHFWFDTPQSFLPNLDRYLAGYSPSVGTVRYTNRLGLNVGPVNLDSGIILRDAMAVPVGMAGGSLLWAPSVLLTWSSHRSIPSTVMPKGPRIIGSWWEPRGELSLLCYNTMALESI